MTPPIRIANCSGFYGDRLSAASEMVDGGPIDVLTGDWLAELTMLILARSRTRSSGAGFARTFVVQMEQVMGSCLDRGIKVVSNAGGLDPAGCAEAVAAVADRLGLAPNIAFVDGDDLMPRIGELVDAGSLSSFGLETTLGEPGAYVTANAYLGGWGITEALERGADIVITGRVTDAALVCGPSAWHHGWRRDDWDPLAGAVAAGHVIECSAQATGGNYSFFTEIPGYDEPGGASLGYPWAEVAADGSAVIGKHDGTGGLVSIGTVTSQLLYEIDSPSYAGPDVIARFDTARLEQVATDRVRISGVRGLPPPPTLKVGINEIAGFRNSVEVALTGLDIEEKAAFARAAFWARCPTPAEEFASVDSRVIRTDRADPRTNEQATAVWRLTVEDPDEDKVGRSFADAMVETALASIPGMYALTGAPSPAKPYGIFRPASIDASMVHQTVHLADGTQIAVPAPAPARAVDPAPPPRPTAAPPEVPSGGSVPKPLGRVAGARSGDKGGDANLGVFVRTDVAWAWLDAFLDIPRLRRLLPEASALDIERHRLPNLRAINFVIHGLLGEGVAASTRRDPQAKSLGEWLRSRVVPIPVAVLDAEDAR